MWKTAKPFLDRWMSEQVGMRALVTGMRKHLPKVLEQAPELPSLVHQYFLQAEQAPKRQNALLKQEVERLESKYRTLQIWSVVSAATAIIAATAIAYYL